MCNKKEALARIVPTKKVNAFFVYIIIIKCNVYAGNFQYFCAIFLKNM